jgi:hypothetical protein
MTRTERAVLKAKIDEVRRAQADQHGRTYRRRAEPAPPPEQEGVAFWMPQRGMKPHRPRIFRAISDYEGETC